MFVFLGIFSFIQVLNAQDLVKCDSIERLLQNTGIDSIKVSCYADLCWEYKDNDPNKAFKSGQSGLELANRINYLSGQATCLKNIGLVHYHHGNYLQAMEYFQKALKIYESVKDFRGVAACYNNIGLIHYAQGNYNLAENYYNESYTIVQKLIDKTQDSKLNRQYIIVTGHALNNLGMIFYMRHDLNKSRDYFMKAMDYYRRVSYEKGFASIYNQLGKNYEGENTTTAIHYYEKSLEISKKIGDKAGICDVLSDIAKFYNLLKNFRKAIEYSKEQLQLSTEIQYLESQRMAFKNLSSASEGLDDNKEAFRNYKLYKLISDSIFNVEKQKQATYLEVFLETERKQNEIVLLNKDNRLQETEIKRQKAQKNGLMIAILLIFLLAFVLLRNYFRIRKTLALIKLQKKELEQNSDKLSKQASLIQFQKDELEKSNNILSTQRHELQAKNDELNSQNEELQATMEELRNAQAQLVESEKMASLGVLSAGIAHEINNPVNFISSGIEGLKAVVNEFWSHDLADRRKSKIFTAENGLPIENDPGEALEIFRKDYSVIISNIDEGIERTVNVIKSLLMFTRAEQNVLKLVHNIHENLDSTLVLLMNQYKNRINIIKNYGAIPPLYCYPGKLNQILMNILSNAIQSIANSGTITIETSTTSGPGKVNVNSKREGSHNAEFTQYLLISIKDTGEGIPEEIRDKIFQPFFTTKDAGKGTGLGLSISYSLVKEHKGIIQYTSKVNEGTNFMIYLPINNE